jgi:hypothetical protein
MNHLSVAVVQGGVVREGLLEKSVSGRTLVSATAGATVARIEARTVRPPREAVRGMVLLRFFPMGIRCVS